ncbi:MAG: ABC transporter permease [Anaerolineaceae bacterium]|nr:ABC transporter permease [Anaerolineaceae bacterium]
METVKRLFSNPTSLIGIVLLFLYILVAIFAPLIAPPPENSRDPYMIPRDGFGTTPLLPNEDHILGTTEGQFDIFYGVVWGTRTSFRVGVAVTIMTTLIGLIIGSFSGFYGGWVDEILMRITEIFQAFPFLLAAITLTSVLQTLYGRGESSPFLFVIKVLAFITFGHNPSKPLDPIQMQILTGMLAIISFSWMTYARVIRGNILSVKGYEYAQAARVIGARNIRILVRHLLPNAVFPVLVLASMDIGAYVLTFAALSFLGLGAQRGYADWGQMISFARNWIPSLSEYWHIVVYPGVAIILFVLSWNLVGDALRDILDPRMRGKGIGL